MKVLRLLTLIFICASTAILFPVCTQVEVWTDGNNYRYLVKDYHVDYIDGQKSIKQQEDFLWAVSQKKDDGVFVFVEDPSNYGGHNKAVQEAFNQRYSSLAQSVADLKTYKNSGYSPSSDGISEIPFYHRLTPLDCLINECKARGIKTYNIECGQILNELFLYYKRLAYTNVSRQDVIEDLVEHITEIGRDTKSDLKSFIMRVTYLQNSSSTLSDELFVNQAFAIRTDLVDAKANLMIKNMNHIKHIFMFAGADHGEKLKDVLKEIGFSQIKYIGKSIDLPYATQEDKIKYRDMVVENALDLKKEFQQIFEEQKKNSILSFLKNYKWRIAMSIGAMWGLVGLLS